MKRMRIKVYSKGKPQREFGEEIWDRGQRLIWCRKTNSKAELTGFGRGEETEEGS